MSQVPLQLSLAHQVLPRLLAHWCIFPRLRPQTAEAPSAFAHPASQLSSSYCDSHFFCWGFCCQTAAATRNNLLVSATHALRHQFRVSFTSEAQDSGLGLWVLVVLPKVMGQGKA